MNPEAGHGQRLVRRLVVGLVFLSVCATVRSVAPHGGAESAIETPIHGEPVAAPCRVAERETAWPGLGTVGGVRVVWHAGGRW